MLNRTSIEAVLPIAQVLDERGGRLLPDENTPLMSLMLTLDNTLADEQIKQGMDLVQCVQGRSNDDMHRVAKEDIIELGVASITRLHRMTRETVIPHIKALATAVQEQVGARRVASVLPYRVIMREIPAIYSNSAIVTMMQRYPATNTPYPSRNVVGGSLLIDQVKDMCKTGMAGVDAELDVVLSQGNDQGYADVLKVLVGSKVPSEIDEDYLPGLLVAAAGIYNEPRDNLNMTLNDYNLMINHLLGTTAVLARAAAVRFANVERTGQLYSTKGRDSMTNIIVMGKTYRKMLNEGLTPEALIGNEMASRRFSQGQLIENKVALEQVYNREMNLRQLKVQSEMVGVTRTVIKKVISADITAREHPEPIKLMGVLNQLLSYITDKNCDDVQQLMTDIVCCVFYPETDAIRFIALMNRIGKDLGDDADPREVAFLATVKYVSQWMTRQMGVVQA